MIYIYIHTIYIYRYPFIFFLISKPKDPPWFSDSLYHWPNLDLANRQVIARSNETSGADPRLLEPCRGRYPRLGVHVPAPCGGHCARVAEQRGHATGRKVEKWIGNDGCVLEAKKRRGHVNHDFAWSLLFLKSFCWGWHRYMMIYVQLALKLAAFCSWNILHPHPQEENGLRLGSGHDHWPLLASKSHPPRLQILGGPSCLRHGHRCWGGMGPSPRSPQEKPLEPPVGAKNFEFLTDGRILMNFGCFYWCCPIFCWYKGVKPVFTLAIVQFLGRGWWINQELFNFTGKASNFMDIDVGFSMQDAGNEMMMGWCEWDGMMGNEGGRLELLFRVCGLEELWAEKNGVFEGWTWTLHVLCKASALIAFWATMSIPGCINPWFKWEVPFWYSSVAMNVTARLLESDSKSICILEAVSKYDWTLWIFPSISDSY